MTEAGAQTLANWLRSAAEILRRNGIDQPRAEARYLAMSSLAIPMEDLIRYPGRWLTAGEIDRLTCWLDRRAAFEPLAYIRGEVEFYGRSFQIGRDVLIPRPETELMVEIALRYLNCLKKPKATILELGVGTGCALLSVLTEQACARGIGVDISAAAIRCARQNVGGLRLQERVQLIRGSWANSLAARFDLVLCNPPYISPENIETLMPDVRLHEPRLALDGGENGLEPYRLLIPDMRRLLEPAGAALFEFSPEQGNALAKLCEESGLKHRSLDDLSGQPRLLYIEH